MRAAERLYEKRRRGAVRDRTVFAIRSMSSEKLSLQGNDSTNPA
jgi:hypothetical protein